MKGLRGKLRNVGSGDFTSGHQFTVDYTPVSVIVRMRLPGEH